jgi:endoglucanase
MKKNCLLLVLLVISFCAVANSAPITQAIKTDHFGYRPNDVKVAVFSANPGATVELRNTSDAVVLTIPAGGGSITSKGADGAPSGDTIWWVDFSTFTTPGNYRLYSPSLNAQSYDFEIKENVYNAALKTALKTFYYQRCNTPKTAAHAGNWADTTACHMSDTAVRPAAGHTDFGTFNLTGGHHDAGDYNKYVWGAASTAVLFLLRAYEDNPGLFKDGDLNIPESGNGIPDLLDEVKWELDWFRKMQLASGAVLYQMHVDGFASNAPPSIDTNIRYYQNPNMESGAVFAGTLAYASRVFANAGMTTYSNTLKTAANNAWAWLLTQSDSASDSVRETKAWAAAEIYRTSGTASAKTYVDNFYPSSWAGRFFNVSRYDTHAAVTYIQTPGATAIVVSNMQQDIRDQVNYLFSNNDLYRNGMPSWSYHWGSNTPRAAQGLFLLKAAQLGLTGSHTAQECIRHAQDFLHFFHGQNALNMMYLSNMASLGGEHSSFQFYHAWFGDSANNYSRTNFMGKPSSIVEPDYPYYKGTDNHGVNDNKTSTHGPAPGFVPGGPNASYSGTAVPPANAGWSNRYYRDWADQTVWTAMTWEITENSIGYQGPYVALAAYFSQVAGCTSNAQCDDGLFCNGAETCVSGSCQPGTNPCPGQSCDENGNFCFVDPCDHDGVCEANENCNNCASDCIASQPAGCGNGVCEPSTGEDCVSCASDCRGKQSGPTKNRFCCGDGDGSNPVTCSDSRCTSEGFACSAQPPVASCCGDLVCQGAETSCNCGIDCGPPDPGECDPPPPPGCDNDGVCEQGENCNTCGNDCSGRTGGKPTQRYCCGDGIQQSAEGNGVICDGNY